MNRCDTLITRKKAGLHLFNYNKSCKLRTENRHHLHKIRRFLECTRWVINVFFLLCWSSRGTSLLVKSCANYLSVLGSSRVLFSAGQRVSSTWSRHCSTSLLYPSYSLLSVTKLGFCRSAHRQASSAHTLNVKACSLDCCYFSLLFNSIWEDSRNRWGVISVTDKGLLIVLYLYFCVNLDFELQFQCAWE